MSLFCRVGGISNKLEPKIIKFPDYNSFNFPIITGGEYDEDLFVSQSWTFFLLLEFQMIEDYSLAIPKKKLP